LYGTLLGIISILPFALIYYICTRIYWWVFFDYITLILNSVSLNSPFWDIIIYILSCIFLGISFYFSYILLIKLNNSYLKWKRLPFFKNEYLNFRLFLKYFLLTLLFFLILLIPIILIIMILCIIIILLWWTEAAILLTISWPVNFLTIFSLISFIALILILFYIVYRFIFSYFILTESDTNEKKWVLSLLKESFVNTKWFKKLFDFIKVFFIVLILWFPFYSIDISLSKGYADLERYSKYISSWEQERADLKSWDPYYYENLELTYSWIDLEEIITLQDNYYYLVMLFGIFKFILINWLILMALSSFYSKRIKETNS
jgi:hypothetical protein